MAGRSLGQRGMRSAGFWVPHASRVLVVASRDDELSAACIAARAPRLEDRAAGSAIRSSCRMARAGKFVSARRGNRHAGRVWYPEFASRDVELSAACIAARAPRLEELPAGSAPRSSWRIARAGKFVSARRGNQHAGRVWYPELPDRALLWWACFALSLEEGSRMGSAHWGMVLFTLTSREMASTPAVGAPKLKAVTSRE